MMPPQWSFIALCFSKRKKWRTLNELLDICKTWIRRTRKSYIREIGLDLYGSNRQTKFLILFLSYCRMHLLILTDCRDVDASESIRLDEFMVYFGVEDSKFNRGMFGMFGDKDKEQISFIEFVVIMWNFLTIPLDNISSFAFMLLSLESSVMTPQKIIILLNMIHSNEALKGQSLKMQISELKEMNSDVFFNVEQFAEYIRCVHHDPSAITFI